MREIPRMRRIRCGGLLALLLALALLPAAWPASNITFTVGAYNVENWNYIERSGKPNQPKPADSKAAVIQVIAEVRPDVLGLEEMGNTNDFAEFRGMLAAQGLEYPHWEHLRAADRDRHLALISRFPITGRHSRADYTYELDGQTFPIGRGILDVTIQVNRDYSFRALVVHLKSKRQPQEGPDQALMRLEEARLLRAHISKILKHNPEQRLLAMGDFNDTPGSAPIQTVIGEPPFELFPLPCKVARGFEGTHFWRGRGEWSRIDYLMASPAMSNDFVEGSAKIYEGEAGFKASDHRMIYAQFRAPWAPEAVVAAPVRPAAGPTAEPASARHLYWIIAALLVVIVALLITRRRG